MQNSRLFCPAGAIAVLLSLFVCLSCATDSPSTNASAEDLANDVVPGSFLVEFSDDEDLSTFYHGLRSGNIDFDHRMDLSYQLFKGASFTVKNHLTDEVTVRSVASSTRIKNIWPVRSIQFPQPEPLSVGNGSPESITVQESNGTQSDWSTHIMTQVDKLRAEGLTGKGLRIGLVDSGVDYKHPALGGCFGDGCLVSFGHDLTGDDFDGSNAPVEDEDPRDSCFGHGTHVAGIIAAQTNPHGFTGAAPDVSLGMFKASGCSGYTSTDILMAALSKAHEAGSDIISCSAGASSGWSEEPWAILASRIVAEGVPVIFSAGNSGALGLFYASTPASGDGVASIGSTDNVNVPLILTSSSFRVDDGTEEQFGWIPGSPALGANLTLPLWAASTDVNDGPDACEPLADDTPDLTNRVPLVRLDETGQCTPTVQAKNLAKKGGRFVLYYSQSNTTTGTVYLQSAAVEGVAAVTPHQAAAWLKLLSDNHSVNLTITQGEIYVEQTTNDVSAGLVSTFSSWGPSWELASKPQFTAPGGYILSTYPLDMGGYAVLSGTSMAAPLVAGAYALLAQARNTTNPVELLSILASTAKPTKWYDGTTTHETWAPVSQQGSGRIQAYDAAQATSKLSVSSLELKDSDQFTAGQTFAIENQGDEEVTYSIEELKAPTVYYFTPGTREPALFPNPNVDDGATLTFDSDKLVVPAGGSADVNVHVVPPSLNETLLPSFSGYIKLNGSNGDTLLLPYIGVLGSLYQTPTMLPGDAYLASTADMGTPLDANTTIEMPHPSLNQTGFHGPTPAIRLKTGTPQLRADVVALSAVELPTTEFFGYPSLGSVPTFPRLWASRGGFQGALLGRLADGTILPEGAYKIVVSALRVSGDEKEKADWDIMELVPFEIKYKQA